VIFCTGKRFSSQRRKEPARYNTLQLGLERPRKELYARVDARIDGMLEAGLLAEVRNLLARGYSPDLPTLSAIGYREIISHLLGEMTLDEAVREIRRNTRIFVRRQANWFKPEDPNIHWYKVDAGTAAEMSEKISKWLFDSCTPSTDLQIG
jgi:tRNA dimethylallyltransferase